MKSIKIIEFKARCEDHLPIKRLLKSRQARYVGEDHQVDTYFNVSQGRLKLREGAIERKLIYYQRADQAGPKQSDVMLFPVERGVSKALRLLLAKALGIKVVVDKRRHIYFIDNVKIHLDDVKNLGSFIEVEAIDDEGKMQVEQLKDQCSALLDAFSISEDDLVSHSYSDLLQVDGSTRNKKQ